MFGIGKNKETEKTACCCGDAPKEEACCGSTVQAGGDCCPDGVMTVEVLGSGCKSCHALLENTQAAVKAMGREQEIRVEYVTDMEKIMQYGVMRFPFGTENTDRVVFTAMGLNKGLEAVYAEET